MDGVKNLQNFSKRTARHTTQHEDLLALMPHNQFSHRAFAPIPPTTLPIGAATKTVSSMVDCCAFVPFASQHKSRFPSSLCPPQPQHQSVDMPTVGDGKDLSFLAGGGLNSWGDVAGVR
jgi:hypothetical protein